MASMRKVHNTRRTGILPATATASAGTFSEHSRRISVLAEVNCGVSIAKHLVLSLSYSDFLLQLSVLSIMSRGSVEIVLIREEWESGEGSSSTLFLFQCLLEVRRVWS